MFPSLKSHVWSPSFVLPLSQDVTVSNSSPPYPGFLSSCKHLDRPVFIEALEDCSVDEGSDIKLHGVVTGSQPIKVSWLHNGEVAEYTVRLLNR